MTEEVDVQPHLLLSLILCKLGDSMQVLHIKRSLHRDICMMN